MNQSLLDLLPPVPRLALAYAPPRARGAWLAVLALDARLGQQVRSAREPMLAQIRLAWWRDRLREDAADWPAGEPLLAALSAWVGQHGYLGALVDGWEMLLGDASLPVGALEAFVAGRAAAMLALARVLERSDAAETACHAGTGWAIADLAGHLSHPDEHAAALEMAQRHDWRGARLPRVLRPLAVLRGLGARSVRNGNTDRGAGTLLAALRIGVLGV